MTQESMTLTFPTNLVTKTDVGGGFHLITDYPEERGGNNIALNPWKVFLSAIITCQGVNLAKYCKEYNVDYSDVTLELIPLVEDARRDEFPEYRIMVNLPDDFPQEHIQPMVEFFNDCPVANHLTKMKPILKTYINGELLTTMARES